MTDVSNHPKGSRRNRDEATSSSTQLHSPISLEFAQRLAQLESHHAVQAVILFVDPTDTGVQGQHSKQQGSKSGTRLSKEERKAKFARRERLTAPLVKAVHDVLEDVGGYCLSDAVTAMGTITVQTTVEGVWELSTVAGVEAIIENQSLHGLQHRGGL